jgi:hypothetical protein
MELGNEKGQETMTQSVFEQTSAQFADTVHKASRAASAAVDAFEDGVGAARRAAKRGGYAAEELVLDARRRVQRYPVETVVATFAAGIAAGTAISWMLRRGKKCDTTDTREMDQQS